MKTETKTINPADTDHDLFKELFEGFGRLRPAFLNGIECHYLKCGYIEWNQERIQDVKNLVKEFNTYSKELRLTTFNFEDKEVEFDRDRINDAKFNLRFDKK